MTRKVGVYPGSMTSSDADDWPLLRVWFGPEPAGWEYCAHEVNWPWRALITAVLGWERPCWAYLYSRDS